MAKLEIEADPAEVGFDPGRLERIPAHFRTYLDDGRLPGWLVVVARHGKVVYLAADGRRDLARDAPVEVDTIWRIYSMTKPVTSVAAMILYEEGAFDLRDPLEAYLPAFAGARVLTGGTADAPETVPAREPLRIWHLLTHTAGLSADFGDDPVAERYRRAVATASDGPLDLARRVERWAAEPLLFEPGSAWKYSNATDVLGRLVEVVAGTTLDRFFDERILGPLDMVDTAFRVGDDRLDRLAALYVPDPATRRAVLPTRPTGPAAPDRPRARPVGAPLEFLSGAAGLSSTAADYHRFCQMLLGGGALDGVRVLAPRTVALMSQNHLPGGRCLDEVSVGGRSETTREGVGFGLGFSVVVDAARTKVLAPPGTLAWGGAASTEFWIDPQEHLSVLFFTQLLPSETWPLRSRLRQLVYQALVDEA